MAQMAGELAGRNEVCMEQAVEVFVSKLSTSCGSQSPDAIAKQNAGGMLGYLASTNPECCSKIARSTGVVEAVAEQLAGASPDMQHNAALLLGQLARGSVAFRRRFAADVKAMDALVSLMQCGEDDTVCNSLWALRSLVVEGTHQDPVVRQRTAAALKPLLGSADPRVATNAKALGEILRRPCPIDTHRDVDDEAAAGLALILHTPPPSEAPRVHTLEPGSPSSGRSKRTRGANVREGERKSKRITKRRELQGESNEDEDANSVHKENVDAPRLCALASLIQAAEG